MKTLPKTMTISFIFIVVCAFFFINCHSKKNQISITSPHWFSHYSFFIQDDYYQFFENQFLQKNDLHIPFYQEINEFYLNKKYIPLWTEGGYHDSLIMGMVLYVSQSTEHGLSPQHFYYDSINLLINKIKSLDLESKEELFPLLYHLELNLLNAYIGYVNALCFGITNPKLINGEKWFFETTSPDSVSVKNALQSSDKIFDYIDSIQPKNPNYIALQKELVKYLLLKDTVIEPIPLIAIDSGMSNWMLSFVVKRLMLTGELSSDYVDTGILDSNLLNAINRFRINNAIPPNSLLDEETIHALNRDVQYYIDKLSANLERYRWKIIPEKKEDYFTVNLADFSLSAYLDNEPLAKMKICCGTTQSKQAAVEARTKNGIVYPYYWESPMLYGEINQLVLNPQWNIPEKITHDEYYHRLVKNPTAFLEKEKMYLVDLRTKKPVLPDSVDWSKVKRNNIPYRLVQKSGTFNALGIIKFDFPNSESVYLHDTPNKSGFKKRNRAITHGCIRLERPLELADIIFKHNEFDTIRIEKILIDLGQNPKTELGEVYLSEKLIAEEEYFEQLSDENKLFYRKLRPQFLPLKKKMPLYIEYYTCFPDEDGHIQYRDDIYFKDFAINKIVSNNVYF